MGMDTAMLIEDEAGVLNFLEEKYIFKVYLQINYDITYSTYRSFIEKATARGIKVYALDGASSWVSAKGYKELDQFMDWLKSYNSKATTSERFVGIHLDVEPYLNTGWERNQAKQSKLIKQYSSKQKRRHINYKFLLRQICHFGLMKSPIAINMGPEL